MKKLNSFLCCPHCKRSLIKKTSFFFCNFCRKNFLIKKGIPIMADLNSPSAHFQKQIKYFDKLIATFYDSRYQLHPWEKSYVDKSIMNFKSVKNKVVLDCGCGNGYMSIELAKRGAYVISLDLTLTQLIRLKAISKRLKLERRILPVCGDAQQLPIKNKKIDMIISNAVLEHLKNEEKSIGEMDRVARKNSKLMITVPLKYRYIHPLLLPINYILDKQIGHLRRYDKNTLVGRLRNWKLANVYYTGHFKKAIKVILGAAHIIFDQNEMENEDRKHEHNVWGATNIIGFFKKKAKRSNRYNMAYE